MTAPLSIGMYFPDGASAQTPSDVGVVIPTVLRPQLLRAMESVYRQSFQGRIQIAIGIDRPLGQLPELSDFIASKPSHVSVLILALPYSTSMRHGGVHSAMDGGSLRSILSFTANARYIAYLDDDNRWRPEHLELLMRAIQQNAWAHTQRMLVDEVTGKELAIDIWDSVGVGRGRFAALGGFVDPSCLMIDKKLSYGALGHWCETADGRPRSGADKNFFSALRGLPHVSVQRDTVLYSIRATNIMNRFIMDNTKFD